MSVSAKEKQQKEVRQLQCPEQCIDHISYYLQGLSRAHFFGQSFSKQLYIKTIKSDVVEVRSATKYIQIYERD